MTYNFDPDRWYENHRAAIEARRIREELDHDAVNSMLRDLDRRYDEMVARLDGTYQIPAVGSDSTARNEEPG